MFGIGEAGPPDYKPPDMNPGAEGYINQTMNKEMTENSESLLAKNMAGVEGAGKSLLGSGQQQQNQGAALGGGGAAYSQAIQDKYKNQMQGDLNNIREEMRYKSMITNFNNKERVAGFQTQLQNFARQIDLNKRMAAQNRDAARSKVLGAVGGIVGAVVGGVLGAGTGGGGNAPGAVMGAGLGYGVGNAAGGSVQGTGID